VAALTFPQIDPIIFAVGPFAVRWYGLAYVAGFIVAIVIVARLNRRWEVGLSEDDLFSMFLYGSLGLVIGARVGYMLFYALPQLLSDPLSLFRTTEGGMSFHGGLAGIIIAGYLLSRRIGVPLLRLADLVAVGAPAGIFFGRLANFINGELWGRVTEAPWGMVFPGAGPLPRHPSQLYEAALEGVVLLIVMLASRGGSGRTARCSAGSSRCTGSSDSWSSSSANRIHTSGRYSGPSRWGSCSRFPCSRQGCGCCGARGRHRNWRASGRDHPPGQMSPGDFQHGSSRSRQRTLSPGLSAAGGWHWAQKNRGSDPTRSLRSGSS
jgi:phosphatidylglycerol---prolipoprotein diacylglyceryl transferase